MWSVYALSLLVLPSCSAVVHECLSGLPHGWSVSDSTAYNNTLMHLSVSLKYRNLDKLESQLALVSTPGSPKYGQYQDLDSQNAMFAPSTDAENKVKSWLSKSGATNIVSDGVTVRFDSSVAKANQMMSAAFKLYTDGQTTKLRTMSYSVPEDLAQYIDIISPTTYFGEMKAQAVLPREEEIPNPTTRDKPSQPQLNPACTTTYVSKRTGRHYDLLTPQCLSELYNTGGYKVDPKSGSSIAFANFVNQTPSYSDLDLFEKAFNIPEQNFTVLALLNGAVNDQNPLTEMDGEANLDVQNIVGLVDGLPIYTYITGGIAPAIPDLQSPNASLDTNEPFAEYYQYLLSQPNSKLPYIFSQSYGDHENTVPPKYAARVCNMIGMLGLRGRTVLASSGDQGTGVICRANLPPGNVTEGAPQFEPRFPTTCPYVTGVGGTQSFNNEIAWNATGGGFSKYFKTAWYQKSAINTYLSKHISPATKKYYSSNNFVDFQGRAIPDIAAHSLYPDYATFINGSIAPNGGTSAATPVVASIIALLNDARLRAGLPAMGFLNPWLYGAAADTLNDITEGSAVGCNGIDIQNGNPLPGAAIIPFASWNATEGWDPTTGIGTPDFGKMKSRALETCAWVNVPSEIWRFPPVGGWSWKN